jgi:regulator of replication initiation timing
MTLLFNQFYYNYFINCFIGLGIIYIQSCVSNDNTRQLKQTISDLIDENTCLKQENENIVKKHIDDISIIEDNYNQNVIKLKTKLATLSEKDSEDNTNKGDASKYLIDKLSEIIYSDENTNDEKIEECKSILELESYILE